MAKESAEEMLDELVCSQIFRCCRCDLLLKPPVMLLEKIGNMCHDCYTQFIIPPSTTVIENSSIATVLRVLRWPCNYCDVRFSCEAWRNHNQFCRYQPVSCEVNTCLWKGRRKDYIFHIENHKGTIIDLTSSSGVFPLPKLKEYKMKSAILNTPVGKFVSHITLLQDELRISILDIGYLPKTNEYSCYIQCIVDSASLLRYACKVMDSNNILKLPSDGNFAVLNLKSLKQIFPSQDGIEYQLVLGNNGHSDNLNNSLAAVFKCRKCRGPSYICTSGHQGCISCHDTNLRCLCESKVVLDTQWSEILNEVQFPCSNKDLGCQVRHAVNDKHEKHCHYKLYDCPADCGILPVPFSKVFEHTLEIHSSLVTRSNRLVLLSEGTNGVKKKSYMMGVDHIFVVKLIMAYDNTRPFKCSVMHIGPYERDFIFQLDIGRRDGYGKSFTYITQLTYENKNFGSSFTIEQDLLQAIDWDLDSCDLKIKLGPLQNEVISDCEED